MGEKLTDKMSKICFFALLSAYLEDFKSDDSGPYTKWSMERNCSSECKNFCVTMGGRTKITYCTSCCTSDLCNVDNSVNKIKINSIFFVVTFIGIIQNLNTF